jgi:hypothetical protein
MNSEKQGSRLPPQVAPVLKGAREGVGRVGRAIREHRAEALERKRLKTQGWAAKNIRGSLIGRIFNDGRSVVVTREADGTIEAMIQITKRRRRYFELWIQYFTIAPNNIIMTGRTMPGQRDGELTVDIQPFQVRDMEAVNILIARMNELPR